jgi:hypothetical protein
MHARHLTPFVLSRPKAVSKHEWLKPKPPGVARQLVTFSCFAKEKVTKKKATPVCRPCGVPCVARLVRRLRNSRYALKQSSPTSPLTSLRYSAAHRGGKAKTKTLKPRVGTKSCRTERPLSVCLFRPSLFQTEQTG